MKRGGGGVHAKGRNSQGGKDSTPTKSDREDVIAEEKGEEIEGKDQEGEGKEDSDIEWTIDHEAVGKRVAAHFPPAKRGKKGGPGRGKKSKMEVCPPPPTHPLSLTPHTPPSVGLLWYDRQICPSFSTPT